MLIIISVGPKLLSPIKGPFTYSKSKRRYGHVHRSNEKHDSW